MWFSSSRHDDDDVILLKGDAVTTSSRRHSSQTSSVLKGVAACVVILFPYVIFLHLYNSINQLRLQQYELDQELQYYKAIVEQLKDLQTRHQQQEGAGLSIPQNDLIMSFRKLAKNNNDVIDDVIDDITDDEEDDDIIDDDNTDDLVNMNGSHSNDTLTYLAEQSLVRHRRDVPETSVTTTVAPPSGGSSKRKSRRNKKDRGKRREGRRGKKRDNNRDNTHEEKPSKNVLHLESYVRQEDWWPVGRGQDDEVLFKHGKMTAGGFEPFSHTYQFWTIPEWCKHDVRFASYEDATGHVRINQSGVYYLYAQVLYHDVSGRYAYGIYINGTLTFQCMMTRNVDSIERSAGDRHAVYEQCYTGGATYIAKGARVSIKNVYESHAPKLLLNLNHFTYWGLIKLG